MDTVLDNYRKYHMPNREAAKVHIKLTIKEYGQLGEEQLERQLRLAHRGLYVAGFSDSVATQIIEKAKEEMGL